MFRSLLLIALTCLVAGCATVEHQALDTGSSDALRGKTIQTSLYEETSFRSITPASSLTGGLVGAAATTLHGNDIVNHYSIKDPAYEIASNIANAMSLEYLLKIHQGKSVLSSSDDLASLKKIYGSTDYLLDIKTTVWGFAHFPTDWNNYHVFYRARMRLVRMSDLAVMAEEECYYNPDYENTDDAPTYEYLLNDNANGIKTEMQNAITYCEALFNKNLLN